MTTYPPTAGQHRRELDTPALIVDLDALDRNIEKMARVIVREAGVRWRPHTKGMKSPALAHRLQRAGAQGITCAKLAEAEIMAAHGIKDILIANQIVGPIKAARLARVQQFTTVTSSVDCVENAAELGRAAVDQGTVIPVVIEIDTGIQRAGVQPGAAAVELAGQIAQINGVELKGLMTWEATAAKPETMAGKQEAVTQALTAFTDTAQACRDRGLCMDVLSCGGTITYWMSAFHPGITEIQAGGGIYGDLMARSRLVDHEAALHVMSTVTSRPNPTRVICDAGKKTMSIDLNEPQPLGIGEVRELILSAEHGIFELAAPDNTTRVGDRLDIAVGYSDMTVVLHNHIVALRDDVVEAVWPILGRGRLT